MGSRCYRHSRRVQWKVGLLTYQQCGLGLNPISHRCPRAVPYADQVFLFPFIRTMVDEKPLDGWWRFEVNILCIVRVISLSNIQTVWLAWIASIRHLHISHHAPYLPPKILHNLCFSFLVGFTAFPGETENNAYAKFWGTNKVHYGRCASSVLVTEMKNVESFL